jgi:NAD(P)-dependent dehydrogenase (short-subunit alcohol dehydrogenase family)
VIDINLTGVFLLARAAMVRMCDAEKGSIVVTSSPHALATVPDAGAYASSKGGVHALVRALALEGAPFHVRVNGIIPGTIDTPMVQREARAAKDPEHQMVLMAATHPLNRLGRPEEVANVALFLASPLAEFITGSFVSVDGGLMAAMPSGPPLSYNN